MAQAAAHSLAGPQLQRIPDLGSLCDELRTSGCISTSLDSVLAEADASQSISSGAASDSSLPHADQAASAPVQGWGIRSLSLAVRVLAAAAAIGPEAAMLGPDQLQLDQILALQLLAGAQHLWLSQLVNGEARQAEAALQVRS